MRKKANGAIERCVRRLTVDILAVVKRAVREQVLHALRAARADAEAAESTTVRGKSRGAIQKRKKARGAKTQTGKKGNTQVARARGTERAKAGSARGPASKQRRNARSVADGVEAADTTLGEGVVLKWPRKRRGRRSNGASRSSSRNGSAKPNGPVSPLFDGALIEGEQSASAEHAPAPTPLFVHRRKRDGTIQPIERNDASDQPQSDSLD